MENLIRAFGGATEQRRARLFQRMWSGVGREMWIYLALLIIGIGALIYWYWPYMFSMARIGDIGALAYVILMLWVVLSSLTTLRNASPFDLPLQTTTPQKFLASSRAFAMALLDAARRGDATIAPVITKWRQEASATDERSGVIEPIEQPLASMVMERRSAVELFIACAFVATLGIGLCALIIWGSATWDQPIWLKFASFFPVIAFSVPLCTTLWRQGAIQWRLGPVEQSELAAVVDRQGVTLRSMAGDQTLTRIAWQDAQALARFSYRDHKFIQRTVYLLTSASDVALWSEHVAWRYATEPVIQRAQARSEAAQRLVAIAQARTGLELRDLTTAITTIRPEEIGRRTVGAWDFPAQAISQARVEGDEALAWSYWRLAHPGDERESRADAWLHRHFPGSKAIGATARARQIYLVEMARALLPYYTQLMADQVASSQQVTAEGQTLAKRLRQWIIKKEGWLAFGSLIAAFLLPLAVWAVGPLYSTPTERTLLTQVAQTQPRYFAPLTSPATGWSVIALPGTTPGAQLGQFTPHGYQLTLNDSVQAAVALAPDATLDDDGAVSVTVEQGEYSGAGIALFNAQRTAGFVFEANDNGGWSIYRYHSYCALLWKCPTFESSYLDGAPPTGVSSSSMPVTLLLIRSGRTILLYLNEQFVGVYRNEENGWATFNQVGVILENGGQATFSDLRIYPVPAGMPFWAR